MVRRDVQRRATRDRGGFRCAIGAITLAAGSITTSVSAAPVADHTPVAAVAAATVEQFDTSRREAVRAAYNTIVEPAFNVPVAWDGSIDECTPGSESQAVSDATESTINFVRRLVGVDPIAIDPALTDRAQSAALLMQANQQLSHTPSSDWLCYSEQAADAALQSNLFFGGSGAQSIRGYMRDDGPANTAAGHRRWIIDPATRTMGSGSTSAAHALVVVGDGVLTGGTTDRDFLPWPSAGYFPAPLEPVVSNNVFDGTWRSSRWSLSSTTPADFSHATVRVTTRGRDVPVVVNEVDPGFGPDTIVFEVDCRYRSGTDQTYDVVVDNIRIDGQPVSHAYSTTIFDPAFDAPSQNYQPVHPTRLMDTRPGYSTVDWWQSGTGIVKPGQTVKLNVYGRAGLPWGDIDAVALNVTAITPNIGGHLTAWPTGQPMPDTSNLNYIPGQTTPNLVVAKLGDDGTVSLHNAEAETHIVVDLAGWFPRGARYHALNPARVLETRPGYATVDGADELAHRIQPGEALTLKIAGRGGVPGSGVDSVALNITAVQPTGTGHLTVWPRGQDQPNASSVNYIAGHSTPNMVVAKVGAGGEIALRNVNTDTDLVVDVQGWFPQYADTHAVTPSRLMDTRKGMRTSDAQYAGIGALPTDSARTLKVTGRGGIPAEGVNAVLLNVTAVEPSQPGHLTVWPAGGARPNASSLNYIPGQTTSNLIIAKVGADGSISTFTSASASELVIDVVGWIG